MKKVDFIAKYGEEAYAKRLERVRAWHRTHLKGHRARERVWRIANPDKQRGRNHETNRKGGKYYEWKLKYDHTGIPGEKYKIRTKHAKQYKPFKAIIAPESQIHHEWLNDGTAAYSGVALVEKDAHMHGFVDVIEILDGEIRLLTEEQIRNGGL